MSRRQLFHAADLARALKVAQGAGLTVARVEIEPSGKIVIITHHEASGVDWDESDSVLEGMRQRLIERRAERLALKGQAGMDQTGVGRTKPHHGPEP